MGRHVPDLVDRPEIIFESNKETEERAHREWSPFCFCGVLWRKNEQRMYLRG